MLKGPLVGAKVLDLTRNVAGPFATKLLADQGAEVIKIESPKVGDPTRHVGPFPSDVPHLEKSGLFLHLNTNKLSVTLNLEAPDGRVILKRLLHDADVIVEDFRPGLMADWELDYAHLSALHPSLIVASVSGFGQDGPYRDYQGVDLTYQALGGSMYTIGYRDASPMKFWGDQAQHHAGAWTAMGIVMALVYRNTTGKGRYLDTSILETIPPTTSNWVGQYYSTGVVNRRQGHRVASSADYPRATMPCKDGYLWFRVAPRRGSNDLIDLIDDSEVAAKLAAKLEAPELQPNSGATEDEIDVVLDEIDEILMPWLMRNTKLDLMKRGQALRMPFGAVLDVDEVLADEDNKVRGFFVEVDHPVAGRIVHARPSPLFSATPGGIARAPLLGEHNASIYRDRLGYSEMDLSRLRGEGII